MNPAVNPALHERLVYGLANDHWRIRFYLHPDPRQQSTIVHYTATRLESGDNPPPFGSYLDIADPHWTGAAGGCPEIRLRLGEKPLPMTIAHARQVWGWLRLMDFKPLQTETLIHTQSAF
jgi:hypothetical protein